jgi:formylglycine-generating enzyme required for sulfatase activity
MKRILLLICGLSLTLCTSDKITGTTDEQLTVKAMIYNPDGSAAEGASIKLFRVDDSLKTPTLATITDTNGRYSVEGIAAGTYNIWAEMDSLVAFQDSIELAGANDSIPYDTIRTAGSITAIVGVQPTDDPRGVIVQVMGSNRYDDNVQADGRFTIRGLATGSYRLRLTTTLPNYATTFYPITAHGGLNDTLADTIRMIFTGIPVVSGLTTSYDTLNGTVKISWLKTAYKNFQDYVIYRDAYDSIQRTTKPIASVSDTFCIDTIFKRSLSTGPHSFNDTTFYKFKYRVVVRSNSDASGLPYGFATVMAPPPTMVAPIFKWNLRNTLHDTASIGDSVSLILNLANPTRKIDSVYWYNGSYDTPILTIKDSLLSVTDSLKLAWSTPGDKQVFVRLVDAAKTEWLDTIHVHVIQDIPQVTILGIATVAINTPLALTAQTSQRFGSIVKYRWDNDIGAGYDDSTSDKYTFTFLAETSYTVKLEVTDDDGNVNTATKTIAVTNDAPVITGLNDTLVSINEVITFNVKATDANGIAKCYWDFGDGMPNQYDTTSISTVTHTFPATTKICTTSVMVVDSFGKTSEKRTRVSVLEHQGQMVKIFAAGQSFQMGQAGIAEPVHQVTFTNNFWMDTTEVTQKHYGDLMAATYSGYTSPDWSGYGTGDNHPTHNINWFDAVLYCNARTKASGNTDTAYSYTSISGIPGNRCSLSGLSIDLSTGAYRLPTEAEWEFACRGGTATEYWWGKDTVGMGARVWSWADSSNTSHPVATKIANAYGLYDMVGNVWEWCNDWFGDYTAGAATNPPGASTGLSRVRRGGSWFNLDLWLHSAYRSGYHPDVRFNFIGFRCVCSRY